MTIAVPKDERFNYGLLHALAKKRGLTLGAFVRHLIEDQCSADIAAYSLFASADARTHQIVPESNDHA